jgi:hypothetical protein
MVSFSNDFVFILSNKLNTYCEFLMSTSIIGLGWFDNQQKSIGQGFCLRIGSWVHATSSHWFTKTFILTFVTFST